MKQCWTVEALCAGAAQPLPGGQLSGIRKQPIAGDVAIVMDGIG